MAPQVQRQAPPLAPHQDWPANRWDGGARRVGVRAIGVDRSVCDARVRHQRGFPACAPPTEVDSADRRFGTGDLSCWMHERLRLGALRGRHCRRACCTY
eukprot:scaffold16149_cov94-Isochrysis_galbana.AAC.1